MFGNSDVNITVQLRDDLQADEPASPVTSLFFFVDHHTNVIIDKQDSDDGTDHRIRRLKSTSPMLHELGHALGLTHPGPYNGLQATLIYGVDNVYPEDTTRYTIMSYFGHGLSACRPFRSRGLLLHPDAARHRRDPVDLRRQHVDPHAATPPTASIPTMRGPSSGGTFTFDPYDFDKVNIRPSRSGMPAASIRSTPADTVLHRFPHRRPVVEPDHRSARRPLLVDRIYHSSGRLRGHSISQPLINNIAIAYGVTIENAIGGDGNDTLHRQRRRQLLTGNGGDDSIFGGGRRRYAGGRRRRRSAAAATRAHDHLLGGSGTTTAARAAPATICWRAALAPMFSNGGAGFDTASYANAAGRSCFRRIAAAMPRRHPSAMSSSSIESWVLTPFDDIFNAFATDDRIDGGNGDDQIFGIGGADTLIGNFGNDTLSGGDGADRIDGGAGADAMSGGAGDDTYLRRQCRRYRFRKHPDRAIPASISSSARSATRSAPAWRI